MASIEDNIKSFNERSCAYIIDATAINAYIEYREKEFKKEMDLYRKAAENNASFAFPERYVGDK